ncbi:uncharacterized protein LOC117649366 [Thrips palmi]|uniref:Uncharacterized protein LOC117649366 n=1 Tax=Thrips palmi TaxID=161013 RepID=A0A6P8ZRW9_THRPL|nr:uncharacterized protein LOC117649366 [Thrips palmi]
MALSFLGFGKKKPSTPSDDSYVVVTRKPMPDGNMYPAFGNESNLVSLPYQVHPAEEAAEVVSAAQDVHPSNPLDDVPFKLSSSLSGGGSCEWSRSDAAHFKSVMSRAVHQNESVFKYDFSHEISIMRESNQGSGDL